jgi:hypothetical protein
MKKTCKTHGELSQENISMREIVAVKSGKKSVYLDCKLCRSRAFLEFHKNHPTYKKDYYEKNKEKTLTTMKAWYRKNKMNK